MAGGRSGPVGLGEPREQQQHGFMLLHVDESWVWFLRLEGSKMCLLTAPGSLLPSTSCAQLLAAPTPASAVLLPLCCSKPCCQALEVKCAIVLFDQMHPRWRMLTLAPGRSLWSHRQPSFQLPLDYCSPCWGYQSKCQLLITTSDFGVNPLSYRTFLLPVLLPQCTQRQLWGLLQIH